jgi:hypothetical protein
MSATSVETTVLAAVIVDAIVVVTVEATVLVVVLVVLVDEKRVQLVVVVTGAGPNFAPILATLINALEKLSTNFLKPSVLEKLVKSAFISGSSTMLRSDNIRADDGRARSSEKYFVSNLSGVLSRGPNDIASGAFSL